MVSGLHLHTACWLAATCGWTKWMRHNARLPWAFAGHVMFDKCVESGTIPEAWRLRGGADNVTASGDPRWRPMHEVRGWILPLCRM